MMVLISLVIISVSTADSIPWGVPREELLVYYSFDDGTAQDNSGNANHGTIQGCSVTSGIKGTSLYFDGSDDYVDSPYVFSTIPEHVTFIAFIKPEVIVGDELQPMHWGNPEFAFVFNTTGILRAGLHLADGQEWGQWYFAPNKTQIPLKEWTQVVGVIDKNEKTLKLYINGRLDRAINIPYYSWFVYPGVYCTIGGARFSWSGLSGQFTGNIDEVMIYNRTLSTGEISTIYYLIQPPYLKSLPGLYDLPTDPDQDGLYEDLNGNGRKDFNDVILYFRNIVWIGQNEPLAPFDYNANGRIDFNDLLTLFRETGYT